ncbi:hypothetical protein GCM10025794_01350 [Massilia kyonggiensis]|nr:hypothetical protein [Massilia kyonggiensis]
MNRQVAFKKPTIKATSRAYVHLFQYFSTPATWLAFLERYKVEQFDFGMHKYGDCAVRVIDPETGQLAALGLEIPNEINYHTYVATARSFWTESFLSDTQRRNRIWEVGCAAPSKDEVISR